MPGISELDSYYKNCVDKLSELIPDSIIIVDLSLLQTLGLLNFHHPGHYDPGVTRYFQLVESPDKITLMNDQFFIWITSRHIEDQISTLAIIALNKNDQPQLELAFIASGVYNTSHIVMSVLEKLLLDIQENEGVLKGLKTSNS